jgi:predicted nucleotidyltransferase component of viral defense system
MSRRLTDAQIIELFHLTFFQVLQARLDQSRYVVKGGASLRYYFESLRYSEDVDLDAVEIEPWRLEEKIDAVLASRAMGLLLRTADLTVEQVTKPKQTETTQRWKPSLAIRGRRVPLSTKIEFSHREADPRRVLEAVPDRVVARYALRPPTMFHYAADAAIEQKIAALARRSETQARDLFDLELLLRRHRDAVRPGSMKARLLDAAVERAFELPFEAFQDQVVPFLDPDAVELYNDRSTWARMQEFVAEQLEGLR